MSDQEVSEPAQGNPQSSWEAFMARRAKMQDIDTGKSNKGCSQDAGFAQLAMRCCKSLSQWPWLD